MSRVVVERWYEANRIASHRKKPRQGGKPRPATNYGQLSYRRAARRIGMRADIQLREHVAFVVAVAMIIVGAGIAGGVTGY